MADVIFQKYYDTLSQALLYPVDIGQHLYSIGCISEKTLDEVETLESPADHKKRVLLKALKIAVVLDGKKLKLLASVLLKYDETKIIADNLTKDYGATFPSDTSPIVHEKKLKIDTGAAKDLASNILRSHYGALTQSMIHPVRIAQMLYGERIIDDNTLNIVECFSYSLSDRKTALLKALRNAIRLNNQHLEVFTAILQRDTETVPIATAIIKDYKKLFDKEDEIFEESNPESHENSSKIVIPRSLRTNFSEARVQFGKMFNKIRNLINSKTSLSDDLRSFLNDCYDYLSPQLTHAITTNEMLDIVRNKCTLIDISHVKAIIDHFEIQEAENFINSYEKFINEFCTNVTLRLHLNESFQVSRCPSPLDCEKITFVLDWDADLSTLEDIKEIISKAFDTLARNVQIILIKEGSSIIVTCVFPLYLTSMLIAKGQTTLEDMKLKGLTKLTIGYCTLWNKQERDEEVEFLEKEVNLLKEKLNECKDTTRDDSDDDSDDDDDDEGREVVQKEGAFDDQLTASSNGQLTPSPDNNSNSSKLISELKRRDSLEIELREKLDMSSRIRHSMSKEIDLLKTALRLYSTSKEVEETILEEEEEVEMKDAAVQVDTIKKKIMKEITVELHKGSTNQELGFEIAGGNVLEAASISNANIDDSLVISKLTSGGLAERDNQLQVGDRLISVNGKDLTAATKVEAELALSNAVDICAIVVSREMISSSTTSNSIARSTHDIDRPSSNLIRTTNIRKSFKYHPSSLGVSLDFTQCSSLPERLSGGQAVTYKNKIIVGGHYSADSSALYEYDPETDTWSTLTHSPSMWFFGLTVFQDKLTLIGGFNTNTHICSANLYTYNSRDKSWSPTLPRMPTARMHSTVVSLDTNIVVAGGQNNNCILNCVEVFSLITQKWYTAHPLTLEQSSMRGVYHNDYWYLLGGDRQGFATPRSLRTPLQSLIDSALLKVGSVSCFKAIRKLPNTNASAAMLGEVVIAIGGDHGRGSQTSTKIYALCEDPLSWVEVGCLPVPLSYSCAVTLSDREVVVIGGRDKSGNDTDIVYRIALQENENPV